MEILDHGQIFDLGNDGMPYFKYVKVLLQEGDTVLLGRCTRRTSSRDDILQNLEDVKPVPRDAYKPECPPGITIAPSDRGLYVKRPSLMNYTGSPKFVERMLHEVRFYEILRRHPHANLARYEGCQVSNGRIDGICLQRHPQSLMGAVNPGHLNKNMFAEQRPRLPQQTIDRYISGVVSGLQQLHSLGYVHNDINPSNVMLSADDTPVIIDFDSCVEVGAPLQDTKRTWGWHDRSVQTAAVSNDMEAVEEIRSWLSGDADNYKF